ncbi:TIGR02680 family protein [Nocardiopsis suaedae]|uniref:TIGR02680 family protein n=1 Tax=Nocardiopsis suaedae TaxID=3018444 RepID=A0ABT4TPN4_9ACTN|nr:TIGR02680 family protein [Nocardiopsis suaedae]MDA2806640.1 TIGR02680 family protein [Nocardiopsis suaedae]
MTEADPRLPEPTRTRWQPMRIGIVDMFYYDTEEFWFRDGRLLLRGNNGTGKSKVLALSLPFLLDGDLAARRVEPDGDPKKRMEWNLLLGGEHGHSERLGYTWVEFGRLSEDGGTEFRTLGCGLKAVDGRGIARHWYFVTRQRIGEELGLADATGTALTRERLDEAVGDHGRLYDRSRDYRRAVDEELFGLGEERYRALVELLIQLRQPQLSKRPDEKALSNALTEALPPIDQTVLADAADAFRSLDEDREELAAMVDAQRAATRFLDHYRTYARVAAARKAAPPRDRNSKYETLRDERRDAEGRHAEAHRAVEAADGELEELRVEGVRLGAEERALREAPEMRSARELERAGAEATRVGKQKEAARRDAEHANKVVADAEKRVGAAREREEAAERALSIAVEEARTQAAAAGIAAEHARVEEHLDRQDDEEASETGAMSAARREATELTDRRERALARVDDLVREAEASAARRRQAEERLTEAEESTAERERERTVAQQALDHEKHALLSEVRDYLRSCTELRLADPEGALDLLQDWMELQEGPDPARDAAEEAAQSADHGLADSIARLGFALDEARRRSGELDAELEGLRQGGQSVPPAPHTRDLHVREGRPGAPLWKLVDFRDGVAPEQRAGLEAALEAAGLLDAWVASQDGRVPPTGDTALAAGGPVPGPSLREILRPAIDRDDPQAAEVTEEAVDRLLASVGLGSLEEEQEGAESSATCVDVQGAFRTGVLSGRWAKEHAEYVGEGAREAARRARIVELERELADVTAHVDTLEADERRESERRRVLSRERAAYPGDERLRAAQASLLAAEKQFQEAGRHREAMAGRAAERAREAEEAATELWLESEELSIPPDAVTGLRHALVEYRLGLAALWPAAKERMDAEYAVRERDEEAQRHREHSTALAERALEAADEAAAAEENFRVLQSTVGEAVEDLHRRISANQAAQRACQRNQDDARRRGSEAREERGIAQARIEHLGEEIDRAAQERAEAVAALRRFAGTGLISVALPDLVVPSVDEEWAPSPAVRLAREVDAELSGTDASQNAWERVQRRLSAEVTALRDALSARGHQATAQSGDDGVVVHVVFQGRERLVPELVDVLEREIDERRRILSAREREILENHLITEIAGTLQELIVAADRQVAAMNTELEQRPTSTGMRLRLVWRPSRKSAPPGLEAARSRLYQDSAAWSQEDREAMGAFLQEQIERVRSRDQAGGTWMEHLTEALDYRAWHEFAVERRGHGGWKSASGPASGGERVLSMSIPLFAAASSHYASAGNPHAPRLVTLDEAFAGVDDNARAKCLGLLAAFDLDVVMTSEREWGCYPEVPGLAIAQLARSEGVAAVLVTRWWWDGYRRTRAQDPPSEGPASHSEPVPATAYEGQDVLWG